MKTFTGDPSIDATRDRPAENPAFHADVYLGDAMFIRRSMGSYELLSCMGYGDPLVIADGTTRPHAHGA